MNIDKKEPILTTQLSYREWLVGLIAQGIASNPEFSENTEHFPEQIALMATRIAFAITDHLENGN